MPSGPTILSFITSCPKLKDFGIIPLSVVLHDRAIKQNSLAMFSVISMAVYLQGRLSAEAAWCYVSSSDSGHL